jgi:LmbE family N-acetylglucosaminyl deacetylase
MRLVVATVALVVTALNTSAAAAPQSPRTLVAVFAHADDEGSAAPVLARYAREGAQVYMILASDGAAGGRRTSVQEGAELARVRAEEARCATDDLAFIHRSCSLPGWPAGKLAMTRRSQPDSANQ